MGLKLKTASNGSVSLEPTNTASDYTLTVPAQTGTVVATDASGNVGIGTSSPSGASGRVLEINGGSGQARLVLKNDTTGSASSDGVQLALVGDGFIVQNRENSYTAFETNGSERMRIDSSGNLLVGTTTSTDQKIRVYTDASSAGWCMKIQNGRSSGGNMIEFLTGTGPTVAGSITTTATTTAYNTSSDYRLKENIAPMTGALAKVAQLKPVTYTWKSTGETSQGFIAHELQAVVPDCVTGEKDAVETYVDEDGNEQTRPVYQGIDTSFLVATLTAAIQELKAVVDAQANTITAMEARLTVLEQA